jgi:hypothetical protein
MTYNISIVVNIKTWKTKHWLHFLWFMLVWVHPSIICDLVICHFIYIHCYVLFKNINFYNQKIIVVHLFVLSKLTFLSLTTSFFFSMHVHGHEKEQVPHVNDMQFIVVCQKICKNGTPLTLDILWNWVLQLGMKGKCIKGHAMKCCSEMWTLPTLGLFLLPPFTYWLCVFFLMNLCLYITVTRWHEQHNEH